MKNVLQTQINDLVLDAGESNQEVAQARNGERTLADRLNKSEAKLAEVDRDKISRGNVQKHDYDLSKDKNLWNINDLDEETRKAILGNQNIDINYILGKDSVKNENISKNAVEEKNISFITNGENLFNGKYVNASVQGDMNNPGNFVVNENYRCVIVPVNPDRKYRVMKEEGVTNRFRIASFEKYPENGERVGRFIKDAYTPSSKHPTNDDYSYYTFNTTENDRYVVVSVSIEKSTPKVMVSEGDVPEDYEEYKLVFKENVTFDKRLELPNERMDVFGTFNASLISEKESFLVDFKSKKVITSSRGGYVVVNGKKGIIDDFAIDIPLDKTNGLWIALENTGSVWRVFFLTNNELEEIDYRKYGIIGNIRLDEDEAYIVGSSYKVIKSGMVSGYSYRFINSDDFSDYEPTEDF